MKYNSEGELLVSTNSVNSPNNNLQEDIKYSLQSWVTEGSGLATEYAQIQTLREISGADLIYPPAISIPSSGDTEIISPSIGRNIQIYSIMFKLTGNTTENLITIKTTSSNPDLFLDRYRLTSANPQEGFICNFPVVNTPPNLGVVINTTAGVVITNLRYKLALI